jgi:hypothetical protein
MNYQRIYDSIISRAKERKLEAGTYKERHHIIPRCMNGTDDEDNLVDLTPEEHYVCHQLLVKIYPGNIKLMYAVRMMCNYKGRNCLRSNKLYGWLRRRFSVTFKCVECNSERRRQKSHSNYKLLFCNDICKDRYYASRWITFKCERCESEFSVQPWRVKQCPPRFCSKKCMGNSRRVTRSLELLSSK